MTYSQSVAERVRQVLSGHIVVEKRTIGGGLTFMLNGHMCCSVRKSGLMVRVGPPNYEEALTFPHTQPLEFAGKRPIGYVCVDPEGFKTEKALRDWVQRGIDFVLTLPAKALSKKARAKK